MAVFGTVEAASPPVQWGSFVYGSEQLAELATPTDVVDVTATLPAGSTVLSGYVHTDPTLRVRVDILDASGVVLATRSATEPGESFNVGPIDVAAGGTYTFRHTPLAGTTGIAATALQLDVLPELEAAGENTNDTFATAEPLGQSLMTFGTATRQAVLGEADVDDLDTYAFTLTAGQPLSVHFTGEAEGGTLTLHDAAGSVVATGIPSVNAITVIDSYIAPTAGTYFLQVGNTTPEHIIYSLVTVANGRLEIESNDSIATAGFVPVGGTVLAARGGEYLVDPLEPFRVDAAPFRFFFDGLGQFDGGLDQRWSGQRIGFLSTATLQIDGTNYNAESRPGVVAFPVVSSVFLSADRSWLRVVGQPLPGVEFERRLSWREGDDYVTVTTTIRNHSDSAISAVKMLESHNPRPNRTAATSNDVTRGGRLVVATGGGTSVGLATNDPRAVLSAQGDTSRGRLQVNPAAVLAAPVDPNGAVADTAINAAFDLGTIPAGGSASCTFAMLFGAGRP
ncbi:MAG: Bacterial pre-peptidase C-terminal domain, partial [Planctomycetota bacterium]